MITVISALVIVGAQPDLRSVLALTVAAIAVAFAATAALAAPAPSGRSAVIGARRETPIVPRHCDPDAPGRPRPRAPSAI